LVPQSNSFPTSDGFALDLFTILQIFDEEEASMTGNPPPVLAANVNQEAEPAVPNHSTDLPEIQMKKVTKKRRRNKMDWVVSLFILLVCSL